MKDGQTEKRSRRLPPVEAWKQPDKWIDLKTGRVKPGIKKVQLETDSRGFLFPKPSIEQAVDIFFHEDYPWSFNPDDPLTNPDDHHLHFEKRMYRPDRFNGETTAQSFRELPTLIGRMPRQIHNTFHDLTTIPKMPELDAMREYVAAYETAVRLFKRLYKVANEAIRLSGQFKLIDTVDADISEDVLRSNFEKSFLEYSRLIDELSYNESSESHFATPIEIDRLTSLQNTRRTLGKISIRRRINLVPNLFVA